MEVYIWEPVKYGLYKQVVFIYTQVVFRAALTVNADRVTICP